MNQREQASRMKKYFPKSIALTLVFVMLLTACFTGSAAASSSSDLIIVNKKTNKLAYYSDGKLVKIFPVATGKTKSLTPEGSFRMVVKIKNRPYYKEKIPGGDPANPLGDRWLGLEVNDTYGTTYAIHGNNNESSIGKYVSAGCIRMHNEDIHWLYPKIAKNTRVIITTSGLDMAGIAEKNGYRLGSTMFAGAFIRGGQKLPVKDSFLLEDSRVYIPLRESVMLLGGSLMQEKGTGSLIIHIGKNTAVHRPLSNTAKVNGKTVAMLPSKSVDGRLYIPLGSLTPLFGLPFTWSAKEAAVKL
ncbi:L,D-transpeptidase family protein [Paenibacillus tritici]|uniref:L,D-transpeptidase family protein n=1 Tax=Paenibacillus tritici TaxID=1873425 RepID=UPI001BA7695D|nr:L,D-transpeptidase family protein [Paenibacillus tritici]QUL56009.1 L,D-transpeptidase family protein [Paenibacillus tritici]